MAQQASDTTTTACYRHPSRETGVSCSNCGRPICPDCMTSTPVGMRCPECARQKTKVHTAASLAGTPTLTYALIGINLCAFLALMVTGAGVSGTSGTVYQNGALYGPAVDAGDWWRIVTSGFLHAGLLHLAFNMYFLYFLGTMVEVSIGKLRYGIIFGVSLVGGSLGALLLSPNSVTVGASGAVFGLMGATIFFMRTRGIDPMQSGLGITLLLNLGITFIIPGISIGGHIGGLVAGGLLGYLMFEVAERRGIAKNAVNAGAILFGVALAIAALLVAEPARLAF